MLYAAGTSPRFWCHSSYVTLGELLYFPVLSSLSYQMEMIIPDPAGRIN